MTGLLLDGEATLYIPGGTNDARTICFVSQLCQDPNSQSNLFYSRQVIHQNDDLLILSSYTGSQGGRSLFRPTPTTTSSHPFSSRTEQISNREHANCIREGGGWGFATPRCPRMTKSSNNLLTCCRLDKRKKTNSMKIVACLGINVWNTALAKGTSSQMNLDCWAT